MTREEALDMATRSVLERLHPTIREIVIGQAVRAPTFIASQFFASVRREFGILKGSVR